MPKRISYFHPYLGLSALRIMELSFSTKDFLACWNPRLRRAMVETFYGESLFALAAWNDKLAAIPRRILVHISDEHSRLKGEVPPYQFLPAHDINTIERKLRQRTPKIQIRFRNRVKEICHRFSEIFYSPRRKNQTLPELIISTGYMSRYSLRVQQHLINLIKSSWDYPTKPKAIVACDHNSHRNVIWAGDLLYQRGPEVDFDVRSKKGIVTFRDTGLSTDAMRDWTLKNKELAGVLFWSKELDMDSIPKETQHKLYALTGILEPRDYEQLKEWEAEKRNYGKGYGKGYGKN